MVDVHRREIAEREFSIQNAIKVWEEGMRDS